MVRYILSTDRKKEEGGADRYFSGKVALNCGMQTFTCTTEASSGLGT